MGYSQGYFSLGLEVVDNMQIKQANITPVTIYSYWFDMTAPTTFVTYKRTFLERSHYDPVAVSNKDRFGNIIMLDANIIIYEIKNYLTFSNFNSLPFDELGDYWTLNTGTPTLRDRSFIILGDIDFEFTPGTTQQIDQQVNTLRTKMGRMNTIIYRSQLVDDKFVGSPRMYHVNVSLVR